jgi:NADPH:quinone reductase-like Zn-dependent oxidoreductase
VGGPLRGAGGAGGDLRVPQWVTPGEDRQRARATLRDRQLCLELLAAGKITPIIDRACPLQEAAQAHAYLESHHQTGKVLPLP